MSNTDEKPQVGSAFGLLTKSLDIFKKHWPTFLIVNILTLISAISATIPFGNLDDSSKADFSEDDFMAEISGLSPEIFEFATGAMFIVVLILFILIQIYFYAAFIVLQTKASRGDKDITSKVIFQDAFRIFLPMFGLFALTALLVISGALLLLIPGLIAIVLLCMAPYIMVDQKVGVLTAIERSFKLAKKNFWQVTVAAGVLLLVTVAAMLIDTLPIIGPLAGSLFSIAFSMVIALRYFQLKGDPTPSTTQPKNLNPTAPPPIAT